MKTIIAGALALSVTVAADAGEMALAPEMLDQLAGAIAAEGFNCPAAKYALSEGDDAYGKVMRIYCGAEDGTTDSFASFRFTIKPDESYTVAVW